MVSESYFKTFAGRKLFGSQCVGNYRFTHYAIRFIYLGTVNQFSPIIAIIFILTFFCVVWGQVMCMHLSLMYFKLFSIINNNNNNWYLSGNAIRWYLPDLSCILSQANPWKLKPINLNRCCCYYLLANHCLSCHITSICKTAGRWNCPINSLGNSSRNFKWKSSKFKIGQL